jgi:hypothetical protein
MPLSERPELRHLARSASVLALALTAATAASAQRADTLTTQTIAPGISHSRLVRNSGPWIVNVLRIDLKRGDIAIQHARAHDSLASREKVTEMVRRREAGGQKVYAAVNADFFDLKTGANEGNQIVDGEWWKGVRLTDSPFDTYRNVHAQFALDGSGRPMIERFQYDGWAIARNARFPIIALNANPSGNPEGSALFTRRYGPTTPRDTTRVTAEVTLALAGMRGDTTLYVRTGAPREVSGGAVPATGAVLAGYGARAKEVAAMAAGDTVRITKGVMPWPANDAKRPFKPLQLLIGGWPRIIRDGVSIADHIAAEEGTISRNAEVRHPRTAVGFTKDSSTLLLITVDGRSEKSVGMTLVELADLMLELGAYQGMNFDGGGSTTMVIGGKVVNSPTDPTGEREVGNAVLVSRREPMPQLDSARMMNDLRALAADSMEGRRIGTVGNARARTYLLRAIKRIGLAPVKDSLPMAFTTKSRAGADVQGVNLIAQIKGTKTPGKVIVMSAHYDHVGMRSPGVKGDTIYNGADDNASGTTALLAAAAYFKAHPPENTIVFAWFDGEESGALGAHAFVAALPFEKGAIIADVNMDMVSRNENGELYAAGATPNPQFRPMLTALATVAPVKLRLGHDSGPRSDDWTNQSDQGAFNEVKVPWVYFGVEDHPDYHKPSDTFEHIDQSFFYRAAQTVVEFVRRLDHR